MKYLRLWAAFAVLFYCPIGLAQQSGTVTNHALPIGKGTGVQGYGSLLLGSGQIAIGQSSADPTAVTLSGDVTINPTGVTAIGANKVTNSQLRQSGALALIGRSANSTGNAADIQATAGSSCAFVETSSTIACAQLQTAGIANNAVTNAKMAPMAALTLKGNATAGSAAPTDIDVTALTSKPSPVTGDIVLIQDSAASNAFKKTTVGALSSAGSVASIDGTTGVFTIGGLLSRASNLLQVLAGAKSDQQAATSNVLAVTPLHQQDHPSAFKAIAHITYSGATPTLVAAASFNIASVSAVSTGIININFTTSFATGSYSCIAGAQASSNNQQGNSPVYTSASQLQVQHYEGGSVANPLTLDVHCTGAQ